MSGISVQGESELRHSLDAAARELQSLDVADDQVGAILAGRVVAEAPKRTGHLAQTVEHVGAVVRVGAPYGAFVHARNPFAARALEQKEHDLTDLYAKAVAQAVAQVKGS